MEGIIHSNHSIEIVDNCKKPKTAQVSINRNWSNYGKSRRWNTKWTLKETRWICMYVLTWKDLEDILVKKYIKYKVERGHIERCISGGGRWSVLESIAIPSCPPKEL